VETLPDLRPHPADSSGEADGDEASRLDRELMELLNELRVVLPGVQALFAFLLIVPFSDRFGAVTGRERTVYVVALLASAVACVLLTTAPAFHRLHFRRHDKVQLLRVGNRCAIAGMVALAVAMVAAVFLVTEFLLGAGVAIALTAALAVPIAILWWVLPIGMASKN
jgi:MFS family permease